ncbi:MAG: ribosome maturation factor RimP [Polyangiales bacterium]
MPKLLLERDQLEALVDPVCTAQGVALVDVRHQREPEGTVLRVLIELPGAESVPPGTPGGVTLEDCRRVSRALSDVLDADESLIPGEYRLEVSSPGIERPLVKAVDFERYAGREAKLSVKTPQNGRKSFSGTLAGLRGEQSELQVLLRDEKGEDLALPFAEIAKAHLVFRF